MSESKTVALALVGAAVGFGMWLGTKFGFYSGIGFADAAMSSAGHTAPGFVGGVATEAIDYLKSEPKPAPVLRLVPKQPDLPRTEPESAVIYPADVD